MQELVSFAILNDVFYGYRERGEMMKKFDAIIIGFGKGGKTLAPAIVKQGMNVAIIERSSSMQAGQDYTFLKDNIFTHPSMSEALNDLFEQIPK